MPTIESGFELRTAAVADSVPLVRHALRVYLERIGMNDERVAEVALAVTEACSNVVVHAYRDGTGSLEVLVEATPGGGATVVVRDEGVGFSPHLDSPGLGVGIPVIRAIAENVEIGSNNGAGTELRMRFR
jgi:serine/threonine-protein kinase RsbW